MPEETIAEYRWRRRLRDWSGVCDNVLKLDRTDSLSDAPMKLNEFGVCGPPCEMCVTPSPQIDDVSISCPGGAREVLKSYMSLPIDPFDLEMPSQLECEFLQGSYTSAVDYSAEPTGLGRTCFKVGTGISDLFARSQTRTVVLRNFSGTYTSDWYRFGPHSFSHTYTCTDSQNPGGKTIVIRTTEDVEFRVLIFTKNIFNGSCLLQWRIESRTVPGTAVGSGDDPRKVFGGSSYCFDWWNRVWQYSVSKHLQNAGALLGFAHRVSSPYLSIQEIDNFRNQFDPFVLHLGVMSCNGSKLSESLDIRTVFGNGITGQVSTVVSSPATPWGLVMRLKKRGA